MAGTCFGQHGISSEKFRSHSASSPALSNAINSDSNLERLILKGCINLVEVGESIGDLERLVFLNLEDCRNLKKLPTGVSRLKSVQEIILAGCSKLGLYNNTAATNQSRSIASSMTNLSLLPTQNLGFSLSNLPHSLTILNLSDCNLSHITNYFSFLSSLKNLNLSRNPILSLPENIKNLTMLLTLTLEFCTKLILLPELPPSLRRLEVKSCTSLTAITDLPNLFESLYLAVWNCVKLVAARNLFYIVPLRSIDKELIEYLGWLNFVYIGSTHELQMFNYCTFLTTTSALRVLSECGIFNIFLDGSKFRDLFGCLECSSIWNLVSGVSLPSHTNPKIRGLKVCVIYSQNSSGSRHDLIKVSNLTKGLMWTYSPLTIAVNTKENGDVIWISHFRFENDELEVGEKVQISVRMLCFSIKEVGIQLVYEEEDEETRAALSQDVSKIGGNLSMTASRYEMWTGKYFLSNHIHHMHQQLFRHSQENPASYLEYPSNLLSWSVDIFEHDEPSVIVSTFQDG